MVQQRVTLLDFIGQTPALLIGSAFLLSLLIGSFLNVVIHRLPVMLDRQWREQASEIATRRFRQSGKRTTWVSSKRWLR